MGRLMIGLVLMSGSTLTDAQDLDIVSSRVFLDGGSIELRICEGSKEYVAAFDHSLEREAPVLRIDGRQTSVVDPAAQKLYVDLQEWTKSRQCEVVTAELDAAKELSDVQTNCLAVQGFLQLLTAPQGPE